MAILNDSKLFYKYPMNYILTLVFGEYYTRL